MHYIIKVRETLIGLYNDRNATVSIEWLIVSASLVAIVSLTFGAGGPLQTALTTAVGAVGTALTTAVAPGA